MVKTRNGNTREKRTSKGFKTTGDKARRINASFDELPNRIKQELVHPEKYKKGIEAYYEIREWGSKGHPKKRKLASLNIDDLGEKLKGV